ncbi:MAG: hypothetical protein R3F18_02335 [Lysobacterales bacterium]
MQQFKEVTAGGESGMIAPDPTDPSIIYGWHRRPPRSEDRAKPQHRPHAGTTGRAVPAHLDPALASNRANPKVLYWANQQLFRTEDGGEHWTVISRDLTREDPGAPPNLMRSALPTISAPVRAVA